MMGVPTFYTRLLQDARPRPASRPARMRLFVSGSAPLLAETHRRIAGAHRPRHPRALRHDRDQHEHLQPLRRRARRRHGRPRRCPASRSRIADPETGAPLPQGEVGMIEVRGPERLQGLLADAGEDRRPSSAPTASSSPATSALIDERGYVPIVGRGKDLIITGGYNVYPEGDRGRDRRHRRAWSESAVIGVPHPDFGEGSPPWWSRARRRRSTRRDVLRALEGRLARFKLPKRVLFVDDLPRNAMGKVQKNVLKATYGQTHAPAKVTPLPPLNGEGRPCAARAGWGDGLSNRRSVGSPHPGALRALGPPHKGEGKLKPARRCPRACRA